MAGGVHMPTGEGVSPALWVGLMGISIMSAPTCAYAATTTATPFNSNAVSAFVAGFAVGFLITAGALVAYACVAKRRGRAGESLEATMGPTEFSMPVGDDPQEVGVDVLGLGVAPRDRPPPCGRWSASLLASRVMSRVSIVPRAVYRYPAGVGVILRQIGSDANRFVVHIAGTLRRTS